MLLAVPCLGRWEFGHRLKSVSDRVNTHWDFRCCSLTWVRFFYCVFNIKLHCPHKTGWRQVDSYQLRVWLWLFTMLTYTSLSDPGLLFPSTELLELFGDAIVCLLNLFLAWWMTVKRKETGKEKIREGKKIKIKNNNNSKKKKQNERFGFRKFKCSNELEVTEWVVWWLVGAEC